MAGNILKELRLKEQEIRRLQEKKARQEGERDQLFKRLREDFGVNSVEEGDEKLEQMGKELAENESKLENLKGEMDEVIEKATAVS